jgi:hypothetical protein
MHSRIGPQAHPERFRLFNFLNFIHSSIFQTLLQTPLQLEVVPDLIVIARSMGSTGEEETEDVTNHGGHGEHRGKETKNGNRE